MPEDGVERAVIDHSLSFEVAHNMLACVDRELRLLAVNRAWVDLLGGLGGVGGRSLIELVHPADRERVAREVDDVDASRAREIEARFHMRDGAYRPLMLRCVRSPAESGELHLSARDADGLGSELADVKRRLAALFETMHEVAYTTDEHGILNGMNRTPEGLTIADIIGKPMLSFASPEEQGPMKERFDLVRERGKLVAFETSATYPDGSQFNFSSRMGPILDGERCVGVVLITQDITAERRAEEAKRNAEQQLREYMIQLERSNTELERFASIASHDLQEPLRKIQAFSDRLREKFAVELSEAGRDYLERIRNAAKRMQDLINDLLMFSRLSTKDQSYSRVNLSKVARSVLSDLEVRIEETAGKIHLGELPTIDADPMHMRQLLQNLIANALKFARPETPPEVNITGEVLPADGESPASLRLVVADNGIGIEPRHHERIFGIFERLHSRAKYEGTGVGLAVCRKIVEQHHGSIKVSSVMEQGTTFTILLPLRQPERGRR
jgi:two-component system, LuxR family, sensor kinase FixL